MQIRPRAVLRPSLSPATISQRHLRFFFGASASPGISAACEKAPARWKVEAKTNHPRMCRASAPRDSMLTLETMSGLSCFNDRSCIDRTGNYLSRASVFTLQTRSLFRVFVLFSLCVAPYVPRRNNDDCDGVDNSRVRNFPIRSPRKVPASTGFNKVLVCLVVQRRMNSKLETFLGFRS